MSRFTISRVLEGPADLRAQLPVAAAVVEVQFGPDGQTYFCCQLDKPVTYDPTAGSDPAIDNLVHRGAAAVVHEIVFRSADPTQHPHPGMRGFLVEVFYVIDPSFDASKDLDFNNIRAVASAEIDALEESSTLAYLDTQYAVAQPPAQTEPVRGDDDPEAAAGQASVTEQFSVGDLKWDTSEITGAECAAVTGAVG